MKVEELVESRAVMLAQEDNCFWDDLPEEPTITCMRHCKWRYRRIAKLILSHPDLACKCPNCNGKGRVPDTMGSVPCWRCKESGYIPLAEALREVKT